MQHLSVQKLWHKKFATKLFHISFQNTINQMHTKYTVGFFFDFLTFYAFLKCPL